MNLFRRIFCFSSIFLLIIGLLSSINVQALENNLNIISTTKVTVDEAKRWAKERNATDTFIGLADLYWKYYKEHGNVNPAIAYVQSALETGYGRFGGVLDATYKNPCGLKNNVGGSDIDKNAHQKFNSWDDGVKAHLDHLALYAGAGGYPRKVTTDPRHFSYLLGKAKTVQELSLSWASNSSYGSKIMNLYNSLVQYSKNKIIVIDAGHGGTDPGSSNLSRIEKNINLSIALKTQKELENQGYLVKMVRTSDIAVSLEDRSKFANNLNADLFISIHQNSFTSSSANGTEVYYTTSKPDSGFPVQNTNKLSKSKELAKFTCDNIASAIGTYNRGIKDGNFRVLKNSKMPAILIECGFITNSSDCSKISNDNYQAKIAKAIAYAVESKKYSGIESNLKINSFEADKTSPQKTETAVKLTTKVDGALGEVQYKYYRYLDGKYALIKDWSTSNTITIAPKNIGTYDIYVGVKDNAGEIVRKNVKFTFVNSNLEIESFETDKISPQKAATAVNLKTKVKGESGQVQYKYYRYLNGEYAIIKDWSTSDTITIAPKNEGNYDIYVGVKDNSGVTVRKNIKFTFTNSNLEIESFETDKISPQKAATAVNLKTKVKGESGQVQYKYYRYLNGEYAIIKDWSTSDTITIAPKNEGNYDIYVGVKDNSGVTVRKNIKFTFTNSNLEIESFETDKISPQKAATAVNLKTKVKGESGQVQYKYYRYLNGEYAQIKDWSTSDSITIAPKNIGTYEICVAVKDSTGVIVIKNVDFSFK
ncbi:MAG: N-acetylmuramoyl-L-alanine amidase [Clostridium sp.]